MRFALGRRLPQSTFMHRSMNQTISPPRNPLIIALFCAIIVIIGMAGHMH